MQSKNLYGSSYKLELWYTTTIAGKKMSQKKEGYETISLLY